MLVKMSSSEAQDRARLYKFTKILTLKVAQIVVQSRQGKKITHECSTIKPPDNGLSSSPPNLQWFNLSIPDEPDVNCDTKRILNGEVVAALSNVLCIEISLKTTDGDEMVLEVWTVRLAPGCDPNMSSVSTIYYRMSIMLKSTLSISRITPAYKMSRQQNRENYKIFHKIYGGPPNSDLLGDGFKTIKVSELCTPIGTLMIEVLYRTKMTILPDDKHRLQQALGNSDIMVKSDHFPMESPRRHHTEKKEVDLNKPLTVGAFVDVEKMKELHDALSLQLPPEPPMRWLLAEKEKMEKRLKLAASGKMTISKPGNSSEGGSYSVPSTASKAIEVPRKEDKYASLMEFPFADGSPITELANFYQECLHARSTSDEWTDVVAGEASASTDSDSLSQQLKMFEDAVPEFDSMVASMFSNSDHGSDH